ncbi:tetratricopeptide repeat protein [Rhodocaloribacter sp.]
MAQPATRPRFSWRRLRSTPGVYAALCVALWPFPLLNILHVESAAVVATVAFFAAGWASLNRFERGEAFGRVLGGQLAALAVPWALLTVTLLWTPNCGYAQGLMLFVLFAGGSVALAVALAYALAGTRRRRKRTIFALIGLAVLVLTPLYDLGLHPQFYVYNHVFGGVPGPIYDEEPAIRFGLFAFRGLSMLWAGLLFAVGRRLRARRDGRGTGALNVSALLAMLIGLCYLFSGPLGINTPESYLQRALGGVFHTAHFDLYYAPGSIDAGDLSALAEDHEYRYARLAERLGVEPHGRIASYLYPDADTKARLIGARRTNVAPVWLPRPQTHVLLDEYEVVFAHELAHVFSRSFGLPVVRASLSVGLVEGFAVAMEPPDGLPTPHEQVLSAALRRARGDLSALTLADDLTPRLTPLGFWTGRSAVSYTTMGSFVGYLVETYGAERFERVYAHADFEAVYGRTARVLAGEWQAFLTRLPVVARAAAPLAEARFAVPSLFEKRCPHYVPVYRRRYREGVKALVAGDTTRALAKLADALARRPDYLPALDVWAVVMLARDAPEAVTARLDTMAATRRVPALALRLGDAYAMTARPDSARARYEAAYRALPLYAHEAAAGLVLRKSLAEYPGIVRILVAPDSAVRQAERLSAWAERPPAARVMEALRWAAAGRYARAAEILGATPDPAPSAATPARREGVRRQATAWRAAFLHRAGDLDEAAREARHAARAYRDVGDLNEAAHLDDFAAKMQWLTVAPPTTRTGTPRP